MALLFYTIYIVCIRLFLFVTLTRFEQQHLSLTPSLSCCIIYTIDVLNLVSCATGTVIALILPALFSFRMRGYSHLAAFIFFVWGIVGCLGTNYSIQKLILDTTTTTTTADSSSSWFVNHKQTCMPHSAVTIVLGDTVLLLTCKQRIEDLLYYMMVFTQRETGY